MNFEQIKLNPAGTFESPEAVCEAAELTKAQKIEVLRCWEYEAKELQVAAGENMGAGPGKLLDDILAALRQLGADANTDSPAPTRQGGL